MKMKNYLIVVILTVLLYSICSCDGYFAPLFPENKKSIGSILSQTEVPGYEVQYNLKYGPHRQQNYDLYKPKRDSATRNLNAVAIVIIHGGGWAMLDKHFVDQYVQAFKNQKVNITIFNLNHRLALEDGFNFHDIMGDFDRFLRHYDSLSVVLHLHNKPVLWGYSSGGHLALCHAYKYAYKRIAGVVVVGAPTDLTDEAIRTRIRDNQNRSLAAVLVGHTFAENPEAYYEASPCFLVKRNSPPTLLFYGGSDFLVSSTQGMRLYEELSKQKVKSTLHVLPDATHDMYGKSAEIAAKSIQFLKSL